MRRKSVSIKSNPKPAESTFDRINLKFDLLLSELGRIRTMLEDQNDYTQKTLNNLAGLWPRHVPAEDVEKFVRWIAQNRA